jgi:hypothetical protein
VREQVSEFVRQLVRELELINQCGIPPFVHAARSDEPKAIHLEHAATCSIRLRHNRQNRPERRSPSCPNDTDERVRRVKNRELKAAFCGRIADALLDPRLGDAAVIVEWSALLMPYATSGQSNCGFVKARRTVVIPGNP